MKKLTIPDQTIARLPLYLRRSEELYADGKEAVTSHQFVKDLPGITSDNLRKDLSYFGNYGKKGRGYSMPRLVEELRNILKLQAETEVLLVGVGNLGTALLTHQDFSRWGLSITLAFDRDPEIVGKEIGGVRVLPVQKLESKIRSEGVELALLAVPANEAQMVADELTSSGIKGILNFAPALLDTPEEVKVMQLDITSKLKELNYYLEETETHSTRKEQKNLT